MFTKKKWKKNRFYPFYLFYIPDFVTMQTHSKKSAFNRSRFYFEIILIAATPCCFCLFHCINKREVRPDSLRRSFRASSSKRLLSYTFVMYTGFDSTRHLHICKHTPTGSPSAGYHKYKVHPSNDSTQFIGHRFSYAIIGCGEMVIINSGWMTSTIYLTESQIPLGRIMQQQNKLKVSWGKVASTVWSLLFMLQKWLQKFDYYQRVYVLTGRCWAKSSQRVSITRIATNRKW